MNPAIGNFPLEPDVDFLKYVSALNLTQHLCDGPAILSGLLDFIAAVECDTFTSSMRDAVTTLCTDTYMAYMLLYLCMTLLFSIMVIIMI